MWSTFTTVVDTKQIFCEEIINRLKQQLIISNFRMEVSKLELSLVTAGRCFWWLSYIKHL